jgi:hypothetical protein
MKNFLILVVLMHSVLASADFQCILNYAPIGMEVNEKNFDDYAKKITFSTKAKKGRLLEFKGDQLKIWNKNDLILVNFKDSQTQFTFQTSYNQQRESFSFSLSNDRGLTCERIVPKGESDPKTLEHFGSNVELVFNENLTFKYFQQNVRERMRPIIFQDGQLYTNDSNRSNLENYCVLEAQLKLDEDISVDKMTRWPVKSMQRLDNSDKFYVYSYSFVDIARGKKMIESFGLVAFSFVCNIKKNEKFTKDLLSKITKNRVELAPRK